LQVGMGTQILSIVWHRDEILKVYAIHSDAVDSDGIFIDDNSHPLRIYISG
ncbi:hypothetical protein AVEN_273977-1, partial [Araneus ventricosus]